MEIDNKKRLPSVEVTACLECAAGTNERNRSDLILAWFQEADEDPFAKVVSHLRTISWEEKAREGISKINLPF